MKYPHDHLLGKAGQHAVMAEFLANGYNVAVPDVDTGDDFLVFDLETGDYTRIQVKTSSTIPLKTEPGFQAQFWVRQRQLIKPKQPKLFYVFAARHDEGWEYIVISRRSLLMEQRVRSFGILNNEMVLLGLTFRQDRVTGHGRNLQGYRNNFARYWEMFAEEEVAA